MALGEKVASSRWRLIRPLLIGACIVALVCLVLAKLLVWLFLALFWSTGDTHVVLRNKTESTASEIVLRLESAREETVDRIDALGPGEERKLRIHYLDLHVELSVSLAGRKVRYEIPYVDLWAGETYAIELHPGGVLKHGYDQRDGVAYAGSEAAENGEP